MAAIPSLIPQPPQKAQPVRVDDSPFWIGSGEKAALRLYLPGIASRHVALTERADGYWVIPGEGRATVNGAAIGAGVLLRKGDALELVPGCSFVFDSGVADVPAAVAPIPADQRERPAEVKRKKVRAMRASSRYSLAVRITFGAAMLLMIASVAVIYRALTHKSAAQSLSAEDALVFDSLLVVAYDHIERGTTLLEFGANVEALQNFAAGINTLKTSRLREHQYIVPRIEALEASVAAIYREKQIAVPTAYRNAKATIGLVSRSLKEALSASDFAQRFADVRRTFRERFADSLTITGTDHAEHVSLYGQGGAIDIRSRTLSRAQVEFLVNSCRAQGIRVKDFSQDSVLQRQIQSAMRAGLAARAGTGLHIHIDRFANRRDAFTVP